MVQTSKINKGKLESKRQASDDQYCYYYRNNLSFECFDLNFVWYQCWNYKTISFGRDNMDKVISLKIYTLVRTKLSVILDNISYLHPLFKSISSLSIFVIKLALNNEKNKSNAIHYKKCCMKSQIRQGEVSCWDHETGLMFLKVLSTVKHLPLKTTHI